MNPKAITNNEMYGKKSVTDDWTPGIFSKLWEMYNGNRGRYNLKYWIVCDGPVDTIWIESLNTVLDDNKILTLASGDRFPMAETVKLVFEVENLNNASPATVSRCGIVYVSEETLGYTALINTYVKKRQKKDAKLIGEIFKEYVVEPDLIKIIRKECSYPVININIYTIITNVLRVLQGLLI